jgi:dTDP-4-dehydrorhamnose reductase
VVISVKVAILGATGQLGSDLVKVFGEGAIPLTHRDLDVTDPESVKIFFIYGCGIDQL